MKTKIFWLALGILLLTALMLAPSVWTLIFYLWYWGRVIALKEKGLIKWLVVSQLLMGLYLYLLSQRMSHFIAGEADLTLEVAIDSLKVEGDLVQFKGQELTTGEKFQVFYYLKSEAEQAVWLNQERSFQVSLLGQLTPPGGQRNFHGFDYQAYLSRQNIDWLFEVEKVQGLVDLPYWAYFWPNLRQSIYSYLQRLDLGILADYFQALFLNDKSGIDPSAMAAYQEIGIIHLFSLSGFHVNYLLALLKRSLLRLGVLVEYYQWIALVVLILYGCLLGLPYGMIRAIGSYLYAFIQRRANRPVDPWAGLAWSVVFILLINPQAIFSLGFQLSYALTATLLIIKQAPPFKHAWQEEFIFSLSCTLVTIPFLIISQAGFSWLALWVNYFYSWLFSVCLFPGLLLVVGLGIGGLGWLVTLVSWPLTWVILHLEKLSVFFSDLPGFYWLTGHIPFVFIMCYCLVLAYWLDRQVLADMKGRGWLVLASALLALYLFPYLSPLGQVAVLDIGQGDCILVKPPFSASAYLIDAAGRPTFPKEDWQERPRRTLFESQIQPALAAQGVRSLAGLFLTHGDFDHYGSAPEIIRQIPVDTLYLPVGMQEDHEVLTALDQALKASKNPHIQVVWLQAGQSLTLSRSMALEVLMPEESGTGENEDSLAMLGAMGPLTFLFTGDIDGSAEVQMADKIKGPIDVLKVAHHGSDHSSPSDLIAQWQPHYALISVGENNRYGHPSDRVVDDLAAVQATTFRTDRDGAIHYFYLGRHYRFKTVKAAGKEDSIGDWLV